MHLARELHAVHSVHTEVSDQNVEIVFVEFLQSVSAAIGANGTVALHLQDFAAQSRQHLMVIDEKDRSHEMPPISKGNQVRRTRQRGSSLNSLFHHRPEKMPMEDGIFKYI